MAYVYAVHAGRVTIFSAGGKVRPILNFMELHTLTLAAGLLPIFLHGCEIKSGSCLGMRLARVREVSRRMQHGLTWLCAETKTHNFLDDTVSSRPDLAATSYVLMTAHPRRELTDDTQTLSDANLMNALIIQRKT